MLPMTAGMPIQAGRYSCRSNHQWPKNQRPLEMAISGSSEKLSHISNINYLLMIFCLKEECKSTMCAKCMTGTWNKPYNTCGVPKCDAALEGESGINRYAFDCCRVEIVLI